MTKKFTVNCDINGQRQPFDIFIGQPEGAHHPLHFQADWLAKVRGGSIPPEIMDSVASLKELAVKNNVSFEELCVYALGAAQQETDDSMTTAEEAESEPVEPVDIDAAPESEPEPVEYVDAALVEAETVEDDPKPKRKKKKKEE